MAKKPKGDPDYDVGYGKPPKHTQFQKGQSGNPSGKSKKEASTEIRLQKLLKGEVAVNKSGSQVTMTQQDVMLQALVNNAMKGNLAAIKYINEMTGLDLSDVSITSAYTLTEADFQVMNSRADWLSLIEEAQAAQSQEEDQGGDDDPS